MTSDDRNRASRPKHRRTTPQRSAGSDPSSRETDLVAVDVDRLAEDPESGRLANRAEDARARGEMLERTEDAGGTTAASDRPAG